MRGLSAGYGSCGGGGDGGGSGSYGATAGGGGDFTADQVDQLRRRVKFFFMDPCSKFKARRHIPWKMGLQFIKILIITGQVRVRVTGQVGVMVTWQARVKATWPSQGQGHRAGEGQGHMACKGQGHRACIQYRVLMSSSQVRRGSRSQGMHSVEGF